MFGGENHVKKQIKKDSILNNILVKRIYVGSTIQLEGRWDRKLEVDTISSAFVLDYT
jgi:hypothetical protein